MTDEERLLIHYNGVLARQPQNAQAMVGLVRTLAALGRRDEAVALIAQAEADRPTVAEWALSVLARTLPNDLDLGMAFCRSPVAQADPQKAFTRWSQLVRRLAGALPAQLGYIGFLRAQGRNVEAVAATRTALRSLPTSPDLLAAGADAAEAAGDWASAAEFWARRAELHPEDTVAASRAEAAGLRREAGLPAPPPLKGETNDAIKALLTGFESLGSNCEFGLLQRRYGGEPLGLLRFAGTEPETLLQLLQTNFAGMGEPDKMRYHPPTASMRLVHLFPVWTIHSPEQALMARPGEGDLTEEEQKFFQTQCKHLTFLRKKLLRDLATPSKILIYQRPQLDDGMIADLHAAIQSYGPNWLVAVRLADDAHPPGTIEWPQDRLMVAAIDRPGRGGKGTKWDISEEYWVHFCRTAQTRRAAAS